MRAAMLPLLALGYGALVLIGASQPALSQAAKGAPANTGVSNALQGFSQNKDRPVQIEAQQLDVRDKDKVAVFSGNVIVTQGDTIMKSKTLHVFYEQEDAKPGAAKNTMKAAQPGPGGRQGIKRLEARGGVLVIQKEQTATGETGIFEMKTNTVTLEGGKEGVVINQGNNVLRGQRLVVDLTTSFARVEGRVTGIFSTNKEPGKDDKPDKPATSGQAPAAAKPAPKKPGPSPTSGSPFPAPVGQSSSGGSNN